MAVEKSALIDAFSDTVGAQQAEAIVARATEQAGQRSKATYSTEEALAIAEEVGELDDVGTFVTISANTVQTRIQTGSI
jgi:hypothetical protein